MTTKALRFYMTRRKAGLFLVKIDIIRIGPRGGMVDAQDLGSCESNLVEVQVLSGAPVCSELHIARVEWGRRKQFVR